MAKWLTGGGAGAGGEAPAELHPSQVTESNIRVAYPSRISESNIRVDYPSRLSESHSALRTAAAGVESRQRCSARLDPGSQIRVAYPSRISESRIRVSPEMFLEARSGTGGPRVIGRLEAFQGVGWGGGGGGLKHTLSHGGF